ncbi:plasmid replication initiator TrfA [Methylomagnum sp.]
MSAESQAAEILEKQLEQDAPQLDRATRQALARLGASIAAKDTGKPPAATSNKPTAEIIQLPLWPEPVRAMPNPVLRSALFPAIQSKARRFLNDELISAVQGVEIRFKGEQLNQEDLEVCAHVYHLGRTHPLGNVCHFTANGFLKALGRSTGKSQHVQLHQSLRRLQQPLEIKIGRFRYFGALIMEGVKDDETRHYLITLNPKLAGLFAQGWTGLDWQHRQKLRGKPLALWLHGFYTSHAEPYPYKVETLRDLCGSQEKTLFAFRQKLRRALQELENIGFLSSWEIDAADLVRVSQVKTITQKPKTRKPRK